MVVVTLLLIRLTTWHVLKTSAPQSLLIIIKFSFCTFFIARVSVIMVAVGQAPGKLMHSKLLSKEPIQSI